MSTFSRSNIRAAKLTPSLVLEIRQKYATGTSQAALSREYGVGVGQVGRIVRGEAWQQFSTIKSAAELEADRLKLLEDAKASEARFAALFASITVEDKPQAPLIPSNLISKSTIDKANAYGVVIDSPKETDDAIPKD